MTLSGIRVAQSFFFFALDSCTVLATRKLIYPPTMRKKNCSRSTSTHVRRVKRWCKVDESQLR